MPRKIRRKSRPRPHRENAICNATFQKPIQAPPTPGDWKVAGTRTRESVRYVAQAFLKHRQIPLAPAARLV